MQTRTKRQREILDYIVDFVESQGYEPSYQQIARHCGVSSKGGIARHIEALERKGLLKRSRKDGSFHLEVYPRSAVTEHICEVEWLDDPSNRENGMTGRALFVPKAMLGYLPVNKIKGFIVPDNAMLDEHIAQGDIALIEQKSFARDGDCVAALLDRKRIALGNYYRKGPSVELRPANENYDIIRLPADRILILGLFRCLLRPA